MESFWPSRGCGQTRCLALHLYSGGSLAEDLQMTQMVTKRWNRYGKDRIYVSTPDGQRVGWLDLLDGSRHLELPEHEAPFMEALQPFLPSAAPLEAVVAPAPDQIPVPRRTAPTAGSVSAQPEWRDLAQNRPGEQVRAEADAHLAEMRGRSRVGTFLARAFDAKTDERACAAWCLYGGSHRRRHLRLFGPAMGRVRWRSPLEWR